MPDKIETIFMIAYEEYGEYNKILTIRDYGAWPDRADADAYAARLNAALHEDQRRRWQREYDAYLHGITEHNALVERGLRDGMREDNWPAFRPSDTPCFKVVSVTLNYHNESND